GDPAALDDVDRLVKIPTARRYYNAACAVARYADMARQPRQLAHAMELLKRALELGFPPAQAHDDPDLAPFRDMDACRTLVGPEGGNGPLSAVTGNWELATTECGAVPTAPATTVARARDARASRRPRGSHGPARRQRPARHRAAPRGGRPPGPSRD